MFNHYLPVMHLVGKQREGIKVRKQYDRPQTQIARVQAAGILSAPTLVALDQERLEVAPGPCARRRQLDRALERLWALHVREQEISSVR